MDLDIFGGLAHFLERELLKSTEVEMKPLSYLKNTDSDSTESKQEEGGLPSEPPGLEYLNPHPLLLKAVPPSPLEMLIPVWSWIKRPSGRSESSSIFIKSERLYTLRPAA